MEWREHTTVSCEDAFREAQRWLEEVTRKSFTSTNFRCALEDGVLLCDLINQLKPGVIKRVNRLSTPIAGLDNVNVFLKACGKLGLKEAQLFHPGDLQDLSTRATLRRDETNRRLKNVLITIYWLGRKAQVDPYYSGPQLNLRAFEGLLGIALSKALEESSCPRVGAGVRDSGYSEVWYPEKGQLHRPAWRGGSLDGLDSLETRTIRSSSQGRERVADCKRGFRMENLSTPTEPVAHPDQGYIPAPLCKKRLDQEDDQRGVGTGPPSPLIRQDHTPLSQPLSELPPVNEFLQWAYDSHSDSDSDNADRPEPDLVTDDWAGRRFRVPTPTPPTNFAIPPRGRGRELTLGTHQRWVKVATPLGQALVSPSSDWSSSSTPPSCILTPRSDRDRTLDQETLLRSLCQRDIEDDDSMGLGEADPILDDLFTRKVEQSLHQTSSNPAFDRFLPRYWTPEEETRVHRIKLGSQRRPWYRKMFGLSRKIQGSSEDDPEGDISSWLCSAVSIPPSVASSTLPRHT